MSKRRKNAGEGYGFMFSGAYAKKADAVAKEKKRKGSFIKTLWYKSGDMRYAVMTPRTNPVKRKKKKETKAEVLKRRLGELQQHDKDRELANRARGNPAKYEAIVIGRWGGEYRQTFETREAAKEWASQFSRDAHYPPHIRKVKDAAENPMELMVMGANPHELTARPGETITIRVNPEPRTICGAMIGGYQCTRKPGHRGPHLPQGATLRPRSRHSWGRRNPSAEALREKFTGAEVDRVTVHDEPHMPAGDYAQLGKKITLYVKPHAGGQVLMIKLPHTLAVADESARRIYFVGGDQDVSAHLEMFGAFVRGTGGVFELGRATRIDYTQRKEHVSHPDVDAWRHTFGEEGGELPIVLFDSRVKRLLLEGGSYEIRREGIVN